MSLLEHRRNEILEEPIAMVTRRGLEWFGHVKRRHETENIIFLSSCRNEYGLGSTLEEDPGCDGRTVRRDMKALPE